jgi:hypothetical protein
MLHCHRTLTLGEESKRFWVSFFSLIWVNLCYVLVVDFGPNRNPSLLLQIPISNYVTASGWAKRRMKELAAASCCSPPSVSLQAAKNLRKKVMIRP